MASRSPASLSLPERGERSESFMRGLIADELDGIRRVIEDLGVQLCGDPAVVRSHFSVLQAIDELCQRHENLARMLRSDDMVRETAGITLESLRARLSARLADARDDIHRPD